MYRLNTNKKLILFRIGRLNKCAFWLRLCYSFICYVGNCIDHFAFQMKCCAMYRKLIQHLLLSSSNIQMVTIRADFLGVISLTGNRVHRSYAMIVDDTHVSHVTWMNIYRSFCVGWWRFDKQFWICSPAILNRMNGNVYVNNQNLIHFISTTNLRPTQTNCICWQI